MQSVDKVLGDTSKLAKGVKDIPYIFVIADTGIGIYDNIQNDTSTQRIASDAVVDVSFGLGGIGISTAAGVAFGTIYYKWKIFC
jgi:hypothetical protein